MTEPTSVDPSLNAVTPDLSSTPTFDEVSVERVDSPDDLDRVRDEWDGFVEQSGSDIYFTVDWLQVWWSHYGRKRTFHGLIFRVGTRIVGVLPFCSHRVWAGPVPVRLASIVGADSTLPVFTPPVAEGFEEQVLSAALRYLLDDAGADVVSLSPLSGLSPLGAAADRVADDRFRLVRSESGGPHTVFHLPGSFDEYLQGLSSSQRQTHRRYLRKLNKGREITFRTVSTDAPAYFDRFADMHAAQWRARGKLGHFADWPSGTEFNRDLVARMAPMGRVRFYELAADGRPIASQYCFVLGDRCYWRLPAHEPAPEWEAVRIGRVSLAEAFRVMLEDGYRFVEGGPGHYEYKLWLGADEHTLRRIVFSGPSRLQRGRGALLLSWAELVNLVYYRGWFKKVRPRLGRPPRTLRNFWIKTRV